MTVHSRRKSSAADDKFEEQALAAGQAYMVAEMIADGAEDELERRLRGTPDQIAKQRKFLESRGYRICDKPIYCDRDFLHLDSSCLLKNMLKTIWDAKIAGWEQYEHLLTWNHICTQQEFDAAVKIESTK